MWNSAALNKLVTGLQRLGFEIHDPSLEAIARWTAQGLTAYDSAYVALAEAEGLRLVTDDGFVLEKASRFAVSLANC